MDLSTTYMGLELKNPLVASASPLSRSLDSARRLEDAGMSAIVMYSLFEEELLNEQEALDFFMHGRDTGNPEATSALPVPGGIVRHGQEDVLHTQVCVAHTTTFLGGGGHHSFGRGR